MKLKDIDKSLFQQIPALSNFSIEARIILSNPLVLKDVFDSWLGRAKNDENILISESIQSLISTLNPSEKTIIATIQWNEKVVLVALDIDMKKIYGYMHFR